MPGPELNIPKQGSEPLSDYFSQVVNTLLADNLNFSLSTTAGYNNIEAVPLIDPEANYGYSYSSFDTRSGIETVGLALHDYRVRMPYGQDYGSGPIRGGSRSLTVDTRHYFRLGEQRFIHRHDHLGAKVVQTALLDTVPAFGYDITKSAIKELHSDLNKLRQEWSPLQASGGILSRLINPSS